ncbi:MAG: hypothetical protein OQJ97_12820 [Rhodospirillales bacterium]|nr:hypothetical protein [Rhodospirillales bacterium]
MSAMRFIPLALLIVPWLSACGEQEAASPKYFPLNEGMEWTYKVAISEVHGKRNETLKITNEGDVSFKGKRASLRSTSYGTDYILKADETGVYRVAKRILTQAEPSVDKEPRYVLKRPFQSGASWSNWTRLYAMRFIPPHSGPDDSLFYEKPFLMAYSIEDTNETVTTLAGKFENCIKVVGAADLTIFLDAIQGFVSVPITTNEWYAPGVGLVKLERIEDVDSEFYKGGRYNLELTSFTRD